MMPAPSSHTTINFIKLDKQSLDLPAVKKLITSAMPILDMSKMESYPDLTIYAGKASF